MTSDLDERERASFHGFDTTGKARKEEEIIRKFKEEVDIIRKKMHANKMNFNSAEASTPLKKESVSGERSSAGGRANVDNKTAFTTSHETVTSEGPLVNEELVGDGYLAFEDSVLQKLQKVRCSLQSLFSC